MKGQTKQLADIFNGLLVVALGVVSYLSFIGFYIVIKATVVSAEDARNAINLAQILLSSDKLAFSDEQRIHRGILDEGKLDNLDSANLFKEISYPSQIYFFEVKNLDSGESWTIGEKFDAKIIKTFPVAIKNGDDIQIGELSLNFIKK